MPSHGNDSAENNEDLMFGLLIKQQKTFGTDFISVSSQNHGINPADIILIVETWLQKIKKQYKMNIEQSF